MCIPLQETAAAMISALPEEVDRVHTVTKEPCQHTAYPD